MIDPTIITRGAEQAQRQQQQNLEMLGNLGQMIGLKTLQSRANQMRQLPQDQRQSFANSSIFSSYLNDMNKSDQLAEAKAEQDASKAQAEIGNINAQAAERNANAGNTSQKTNLGKFGAIQGAFQQAALSGDKNTALLALNGLQRAGAITPEEYAQQFEVVQAMTPDEFKTYATGLASSNKDVAPYLFQTKNNASDNATSLANNQNTVNATMRGQDITAQTAANKLAQDKILSEQELAIKNGEIKEIMIGTDGKAYAVYRDGRVEPSLLPNGQQFSPQNKKQIGQPKLSDKALNSVNEMNTQLSTANQNSQKINGLIGDIQSGRLNLSAANQLGAKTKNFLGMSDENSRGVENFQTALNQAVNDVLMMAKGTQTEGDAQRAATVIAANPPRDNAAALQALQRLAAVQQNTIGVLNGNINGIYDNYGIARPQSNAPKPASEEGNQSKLNSILFGR